MSDLDIASGTRVRVLQDGGRRGIVGLEGVVVQSFPGYVLVELDNDPALFHRADMEGGISLPRRAPKRHFRVTEVERV